MIVHEHKKFIKDVLSEYTNKRGSYLHIFRLFVFTFLNVWWVGNLDRVPLATLQKMTEFSYI